MNRQRARKLRKSMTNAEKALWSRIRRRQLFGNKFRRQQLLGPYIVDFVCFEKKLIIELDGGQHVEQEVYDAQRTHWLEVRGYRVLRFWNHHVFQQQEAVLKSICEALEEFDTKTS